MRSIIYSIIVALFFVLGLTTISIAQGTSGTENEEILYNQSLRKVEKATKIPDKPIYMDSVMTPAQLNYLSLNAQAATSIAPEPLKAANVIPKELLDRLYKFYVKVGAGNYTNLFGEFYFNQERNSTSDYGLHYKHFSSQGGINEVSFNGFSTNEAAAYGSKIWRNYRGEAEVKYNRHALHYYGFHPDSFAVDKKQTLQIYNMLQFKLSGTTVFNSDTSKLSHKESISYRPYFDNQGANDHNIALSFAGGKRYKKEYYNLGLFMDFNVLNDDSCNCLTQFKPVEVYRCIQQQSNMIGGLNPTVTTLSGDLKLKIGLMINADIYQTGKFYLFPDIDFSYSLFDDMFIPYLGVNRSVIRNSFYTMSQQNPFLLTNQDYINTNQKFNIYAGIRGTWSSNLSFNSKISYSRNENAALFIEDTLYSMQNRFLIKYDNVDVLSADAHILYRAGTKWHFLFGGTYFNYTVDNETFAWNLPQYKIYSTLNYNLKDKFIVRYNLEVLGDRKTYSLNKVNGVTVQPDGKYIYELKPYFDTDIQLEYRYTKRFSVFANFNNLAGRYLRWSSYPYQAFNILGGATFMF